MDSEDNNYQYQDVSLDFEEDEEGELSEDAGGVDPSDSAPIPSSSNILLSTATTTSISARNSASASTGVDPGDCALDEFLGTFDKSAPSIQKDSQDDFLEKLAAEAEIKDGPDIMPSVTKLINNHLARKFQRGNGGEHDPTSQTSAVVDKFKRYPVPANLAKLKSCRTNDSVFKAMTTTSKRCNGDLHLAESALCKSITAQATALQDLANLKNNLPKSVSTQFDNVFRSLADAVEFSVFSRAKVNETRRENILANLNNNYKHLASNTVPENGLLFGDNLETAMRSVETSNRLAQRLSAPKPTTRPFLGYRQRARGRNRTQPQRGHYHQPHYQPHQQSQRGRKG